MVAVVLGNLFRKSGTGTDDGHIALQHVPKLGKLIQTGAADEFAYTGDPGIVLDFEYRTVFFVLLLQGRLQLIGIDHHAAEFVKAEQPLKPVDFYGNFEQIENGIGLTTKFLSDAESALSALSNLSAWRAGVATLKTPKTSLLICGVSAAKVTADLVAKANDAIGGLTAVLLPVENKFFGSTVTCTGLLTGVDMCEAVELYRANGGSFDELVLDGNTMKEFEDVFLCGMTLEGMKARLGVENIRINRGGGAGLIDILSSDVRAGRKEKKRRK